MTLQAVATFEAPAGVANVYVAAHADGVTFAVDNNQVELHPVHIRGSPHYLGADQMPTAPFPAVLAALRAGATRIGEFLANGTSVVVTCQRGRQRSVAAAAAYLILHNGDSVQDALNLVWDATDHPTRSNNYSHVLDQL